jgi:HD-like signal output (HDOD) protein
MELLRGVGLEAMIEQIGEIPVLPHVAWALLEIGEPSVQQVVDIVRVDPGFVLRSIALAKASGPLGKFGLPDVVQTIGTRNVVSMADTVQAFETFVGRTDPPSLTRRRWWRESLDSANCATWLSLELRGVDQDEAYCAGLLHLFGRTLLDRFGGEDYASHEDADEEEMFGCDHVLVLRTLCERMGLPSRLLSAIDYRETSDDKLRACVAVANAIIRRDPMPHWALYSLEISETKRDNLASKAMAAVANSQSIK